MPQASMAMMTTRETYDVMGDLPRRGLHRCDVCVHVSACLCTCPSDRRVDCITRLQVSETVNSHRL